MAWRPLLKGSTTQTKNFNLLLLRYYKSGGSGIATTLTGYSHEKPKQEAPQPAKIREPPKKFNFPNYNPKAAKWQALLAG